MNPLIRSFCQTRPCLQSLYLFKRLLHISEPEISTFPSILNSCSSLPFPDAGLVNHGYLIKCGGFGCCVNVGNDFLWMYVKLGEFQDAYKVFEEMPESSGDVFDSIIHWLRRNRTYEDVVIAFEKMVEFCVFPSVQSVCHVIRAYSDLNSIEKGHFVHDYVKQNGFDDHVLVMNLLISMYVKMGRLDLAQQVFDKVIHKDIVSWNSLFTGYAQNRNWHKVFDLFLCLRRAENLVPNVVTFLALLSSAGHARGVGIGMSIHGHLICMGLYLDVQLGTAIFDMYAKCERLDYAQIVFEQDLINKTLVSWNALIAMYKQKGYSQEAADVYEWLVMEPNVKPDSFSFANVLPAYANLGNIQRIKSIHSMIVKRALDMEGDIVLATSMLDAYGKCSDVKASELLFACIHHPNTATWNALISVYNLNNQIEKGMIIFREMVRCKVLLDPITMVALFQSCGQMDSLKQGNMIHGLGLSKGFSSHLMVGNALIDMYMRCGCTKSAEVFFHSMPRENIVTWNTMICGYMKAGCSSAGLGLFHQMQSEKGYKPDSVTIISLLRGSLAISAGYVELFHGYILKLGLASETLVMNTLIDSFAKIGIIEKARALFTQNDFRKDQSSWNIMIAGYGMNGQGSESSKLFAQMQENGYVPDSITFTSLLSSCSHCGLIEDGCKFFDLMITKHKIQPTMEHWTCIIDMLGRANGLEEAYDVIRSGTYQNSSKCVPLDSIAVWGALLSACRTNMNMKLGELAGQKLSKMESHCLYHSLLSNLYSSNKKWGEATEIRRVFEDRKGMKKPGLSSLKS
ncbi:pentatricopeptide repeat-containing protein At3g12770-like [Cynara cardunculus var. scolymus]|uniref:Pentatricopeptide repeat-containing protein n=1 Tax=Cynara cardunculus var. scolymus TaxID=59895 RepID=A0A103YLF0_CYNCS|nr:pentatricopeptide repeat-containing protein At3g12770-like [Cynara cardunculus var. scolymus]KVI11306.1 Pentatricopeptide repeat-containing protein [Cynara cardunculus var. scolymus]